MGIIYYIIKKCLVIKKCIYLNMSKCLVMSIFLIIEE